MKKLINTLEDIITELKNSREEEITIRAYDEIDSDWITLRGELKLNNKILDIL